jgi:exopolysaccharide biosynthesis polyprenyl glycosylphosphotransferase
MSDDSHGLAEELARQLTLADEPGEHQSNGNGNANANGNGNGKPHVVLLPSVEAHAHDNGNGNGHTPNGSLSSVAVLDSAFPGVVDAEVAAEEWSPSGRRRLARVRDLEGSARGPLLRLAAVAVPISVVLLVTTPGLTALKFLGLLTLITGVWLGTQHAAAASARISPFAVGVWAPSMVGALNGAVAAAAVCLMFPWLDVKFPEIVLMLAGVFGLLCVAEALSARLGRRRRLLLVGASEAAVELVRDLSANPKLPFEWIGAVTEKVPTEAPFPVPVLGSLADLSRIVRSRRPDLVVVADLHHRDEALTHLLESANVGFRIVGLPEIYEYALGRVPVRHLPHAWFMSLLHLYQRPYPRLVARTFDVILATTGLLLAAPLFLLVALLVRCSSRGPILFRQKRVGEGGKLFELIKFRTMIDGAEDGLAVWAEKGDSRITKVGRVLRATRLDELPQLWNVLRDDMSMIGPRPERPEFLELLEREVPFWARRLLVKPGITGWAQVQGGYASDTVGAAEKLSYDLYYVKHRSMLLNFAIVAKTAATVVSGSGAR